MQEYLKMFNEINYLQKERLNAKFIKSYDYEYLYKSFQIWQSNGHLDGELLGTGQHFQAYKVRCHDFDMVIKLGRHSRAWNKLWVASLARLNALNLPHIPPNKLQLDSEQEAVMQVMPFGKNAANVDKPDLALIPILQGIHQKLTGAGLALGDIEQIKWMDDVPYIIDLSSLITL